MKNQIKTLKNIGITGATGFTTAALNVSAVNAQIADGIEAARPEGAEDNLFTNDGIFQTVANVLLFLVGAISVIMLIIGGLRYVISAGDQQAVTNAKNTILYAIVGIVVAFLSFAAVTFVINQLEA